MKNNVTERQIVSFLLDHLEYLDEGLCKIASDVMESGETPVGFCIEVEIWLDKNLPREKKYILKRDGWNRFVMNWPEGSHDHRYYWLKRKLDLLIEREENQKKINNGTLSVFFNPDLLVSKLDSHGDIIAPGAFPIDQDKSMDWMNQYSSEEIREMLDDTKNISSVRIVPREVEKFSWLDRLGENGTSFMNTIYQDFANQVAKQFDSMLEKYVRDNLAKLGFEFEDRVQFHSFVMHRITRIGYADRPNYYEFYVLLDSGEKKLVGSYSDSIEISHSDYKVTAYIGRDYKED